MSETTLKKIKVDDLIPGMYVQDVFNASGLLLFSANTLITDLKQIKSLVNQGVSALFINVLKGLDVNADCASMFGSTDVTPDVSMVPETPQPFSWPEYQEKVKQATHVRSIILDNIREVMVSGRMGRMFSIRSITAITESLIDSVLAEPDVYTNLCQIKGHDNLLFNHSLNVGTLTIACANAVGYAGDDLLGIAIGAILHDLGKIRIPEEILRKSGSMTRNEYEIVKKHPLVGLEMIRKIDKIPEIARKIISRHHERWNGSGYPNSLKGPQLETPVIICSIADVYDNLTTEKDNRSACLPQEALALIFQGSDEEYPRSIVEHFTKLLGIYPVGSLVKLESGEMGIVVKINRHSLLTPVVMVMFDYEGTQLQTPELRDLSSPGQPQDRDLWKIESSLDPSHFDIDPVQSLSSL